jgi:di/tricarboxylate transporter
MLFLSERLRPDLIAMLVMLSLGVTGILTSREAFSGMSNPSVILLIAVFIMTGGLFRTGVSAVIGRWLVAAAGHRESRLAALAILAAAGLTLFMNNIAAAAVVMPAVMDATRRTKISPSKVLLPMALATQLGGMATLFATASIVASGVLVSLGLKGFGLFDFLTVGGPAAVACLVYLVVFSRRLLPDQEPVEALKQQDRSREQLARHYQLNEGLQAAQLRPGSPLVGRSLAQSGLRERFGASVVGIERKGKMLLSPSPTERLRLGDVVLLAARPAPVEAFADAGLAVAPAAGWGERLTSERVDLVEVLVGPRSSYLGRTLKEMQFRTRYNLAVVALLQGDHVYQAAAADVPLRGGEALLVHGSKERLDLLRAERDWIVLSVKGDETLRPRKMWLALAIMLAALVAVVVGSWPVAAIFFTGALVMVLGGCLTMEEAYQAIEWRSVFLVAGMLPVGVAFAKSGAARLLGGGIIAATGSLGPLATVAGLFLVALLLNQFIPGGSAAPAVLAPIAIAAAQGLGADPRAFALVVAVAMGPTFTPFAHPVNVLVMGPGGYSSRDYLRLGWPMVVIALIVVLVTVHLFWHV